MRMRMKDQCWHQLLLPPCSVCPSPALVGRLESISRPGWFVSR